MWDRGLAIRYWIKDIKAARHRLAKGGRKKAKEEKGQNGGNSSILRTETGTVQVSECGTMGLWVFELDGWRDKLVFNEINLPDKYLSRMK